jgi:hypothetical protein
MLRSLYSIEHQATETIDFPLKKKKKKKEKKKKKKKEKVIFRINAEIKSIACNVESIKHFG